VLATTYGRLEELRWRLRHRLELDTIVMDAMTGPPVGELRKEVADLRERVGAATVVVRWRTVSPRVEWGGVVQVLSSALR